MNRSSIIFAFFIAGVISVAMHDLFFSPVAYGPNNAMHQVAKEISKKTSSQATKTNEVALKQ